MRPIKKNSTDQSVVIRIVDSTDGTPETAVEHDSAGIDLWYRREAATKTSIVEAALAALDSAHADGGLEHIGDGYYRLDLPDAAVATGANGVAVGGTVTGMVVIGCYVHLTDYDPQDAVRLGLTALPNAAADAIGGLPISDAGGLDLDALNTAAVRLTTARAGALTDWIDGERLDVLLDAIPTTAMRGTDSASTHDAAAVLAAMQAAGTHLTLIKAVTDLLPDAGALSDLATILTDTGTTIPALIAALNDLSAANVNAEVVDALGTDTIAELAQGIPAATPTIKAAIMLPYMHLRNLLMVTSSEMGIHNDAGTKIAKKVLTDDGTTYTEAKMASGA